MRELAIAVSVVLTWLFMPVYLWGDDALNLAVPGVELPHLFWFWVLILVAWTIMMGLIAGKKI